MFEFMKSKLRPYFRSEDHGRLSYAHEGEDLVLANFLEGEISSGYYLDIGAHHPVRFSTTYYFYRAGWRGLNVEPRPGSKAQFDKVRPGDITLELGVSAQAGELEYFEFDEPALNGFDARLSHERREQTQYRLLGTRKIAVLPLREILEKHWPAGRPITYMNSDVEGLDLQVLESNDWIRFRPNYLTVEVHGENLEDTLTTPISVFLRGVGYTAIAKTQRTAFYKDAS